MTDAPTEALEPLSPPVVELRDVGVHYGSVQALDRISITLRPGATGLVGRNGAGKSTLLRLLLGLIPPSSGEGRLLGLPLRGSGARLRRAVGYMPENDSFLPGMRAIEQLRLAGELCNLSAREAIRRAHETLSYVGLGEARYRNVEGFSTGMKQRLKLAVSLVHDPELLLLDEPTVGLDPPGRARMLDLIADLVQTHRKSLIISTHLLADIQHTCDNVVMIERGRVMAAGPMDQVLGTDSTRFLLQWEGDGEAFLERLRGAGGEVRLRARGSDGSGLATHRDGQAIAQMPEPFDPRNFFEIAHASGVRLRTLDREFEELGEIYHRLLAREVEHVG